MKQTLYISVNFCYICRRDARLFHSSSSRYGEYSKPMPNADNFLPDHDQNVCGLSFGLSGSLVVEGASCRHYQQQNHRTPPLAVHHHHTKRPSAVRYHLLALASEFHRRMLRSSSRFRSARTDSTIAAVVAGRPFAAVAGELPVALDAVAGGLKAAFVALESVVHGGRDPWAVVAFAVAARLELVPSAVAAERQGTGHRPDRTGHCCLSCCCRSLGKTLHRSSTFQQIGLDKHSVMS
jgi:hypothetical protein